MTTSSKINTFSLVKCVIEHSTDKAHFIAVTDAEGRVSKVWVPKSQITGTYDLQDEYGNVVLRLADWIIKSKMLRPVPLTQQEMSILDSLTTQGIAGYNNSRMPEHKKEDDEVKVPKIRPLPTPNYGDDDIQF